MVGMKVGSDDAGERAVAEHGAEQRFPSRERGFVAEARVDQRPSVAVVDEIDVHMIEQKRQRQPRPQDAGGDLDRVARRGRRRMNEAKSIGGGGRRRSAWRNGRRLHSEGAHTGRAFGGPPWR